MYLSVQVKALYGDVHQRVTQIHEPNHQPIFLLSKCPCYNFPEKLFLGYLKMAISSESYSYALSKLIWMLQIIIFTLAAEFPLTSHSVVTRVLAKNF